MGIWEDPAAGTAAGPLAALLTFAGKAPPGIVVVERDTHWAGPAGSG
jgi:predicted PhzF superfamily epimerase YddE/YHI9